MKTWLIILGLIFPSMLIAGEALKLQQDFPQFDLKIIGSKQKVSLTKLKGKVVIVNFWASWCEPCKKELPLFNKIHHELSKQGLVIIAVNEDDEESVAIEFLKTMPLDYQSVHDIASNGQKLAEMCNLMAVPSTFLMNRQGKIAAIYNGFGPGDEKKIRKKIKELL
ncbi:MAG: TlpA disulfide reductase family protein [Oligoflexia bacterium]|nr:TlpA disulfide reductase family protein [Oligoflexia bacterium]